MTALARWGIGAVAVALLASPADAQVTVNTGWPPPMINPWGNTGWTFSRPPLIGYTPTGTPIVNPWDRGGGFVTPAVPALQSLFAYQYALQNASYVWNPALYPYWASGGMNAPWGLNAGANNFMQPGAFGPGVQPTPAGAVPTVSTFVARPGPSTQVEPGWFARVGPDLAVNRTTGTVLRPYSGVAFTAEGPFLRLPGSGTFTPWGAYVPGTGVFVNPFTGSAYNPQTGLILR